MNEHAKPLPLSERADKLEEQMMHDLSERIATKSTLFHLADGTVPMDSRDKLLAANPGKHFLMGAASLWRQLAEQDLRLFQFARIEAFGEPVIDRGEKFARLIPHALIAPKPRHAHRRAQFP
jgi:hypothetical protein